MVNCGIDHGLVTWKKIITHQGLTWRDKLLRKILCLDRASQVYGQIGKNCGSRKFLRELLETLAVTYRFQEKDINAIPLVLLCHYKVANAYKICVCWVHEKCTLTQYRGQVSCVC
jgi:hypothetical protein